MAVTSGAAGGLDVLVQRARAAAGAGRWAEAEAGWREVQARSPDHPEALYSLGVHAFQRRAFAEAAELLARAQAAAPAEPVIALMHANARREAGDGEGEWAAIGAALAADPYFMPALLAKGGYVERHAGPAAAAAVYRNALKIAPPEDRWPEALRPQLLAARAVVNAHTAAFGRHLDEALAPSAATLGAEARERWREAAAIMSGRTEPYPSVSNQMHVPRLPATPFFDRDLFSWVEALERRTEAIRAELEAALAAEAGEFTPYITYRPGDPVNQWRELNHSRRWSSYHLWRAGEPVTAHLARCPETAAALESVEMARIGGLCPNAMFSALAPRTRIPPHHGETNARVIVHLPLVVPDGCLYRVGFEERRWEVGRALIFDDTIEHEARNDGDQLRVVLIFDVWNPLLAPEERAVVQALAAAARTISGAP